MNMNSASTIIKQMSFKKLKISLTLSCRLCSTQSKEEFLKYQNNLFDLERQRQSKNIPRIEKITVNYKGLPKDQVMLMNKHISTPFNCAQHMYEMNVRRSALAMIDGTTVWDMHRPLEDSCELQLLTFQDENPAIVNKAFWRTCSFMLGSVLCSAFKDDVIVNLHSFPKPSVYSGSFVYDVEMPTLPNWNPNVDELRTLSAEMVKLSNSNTPVERLSVPEELASKIFENNKHKLEQIPGMADQNNDRKITLYRIGNHIDMSRGPMVGNTNFVGRCTIGAVHKLKNDSGNYYRYQGVALPIGILLNHYAYNVLEKRAQKLNKGKLPWEYEDTFQPAQKLEAVVSN